MNTPKNSAERSITSFLEMLATYAAATAPKPTKTGLASPAAIVLKYGCFMRKRDRSDTTQGEIKNCFANAQQLAFTNDDLTYCEGWATPKALAFPTLHAWCSDSKGQVVDITWTLARYPKGAVYCGVQFKTPYVIKEAFKANAHQSLLDDWQGGYRLLNSKEALREAIIPCKTSLR